MMWVWLFAQQGDKNNTGALSLNLNVGWGVGGTLGANIAWDTEGNLALQLVAGGGGDTPGASLTGNLEITNAKNVHALSGIGAQAGVDVGEVIVFEGGYLTGNGYSGSYGGFGFGVGTPVGASGYVTNTTNVFTINLPSLWDSVWK